MGVDTSTIWIFMSVLVHHVPVLLVGIKFRTVLLHPSFLPSIHPSLIVPVCFSILPFSSSFFLLSMSMRRHMNAAV